MKININVILFYVFKVLFLKADKTKFNIWASITIWLNLTTLNGPNSASNKICYQLVKYNRSVTDDCNSGTKFVIILLIIIIIINYYCCFFLFISNQ